VISSLAQRLHVVSAWLPPATVHIASGVIATQQCGWVGGCASSTRPDEARAAAPLRDFRARATDRLGRDLPWVKAWVETAHARLQVGSWRHRGSFPVSEVAGRRFGQVVGAGTESGASTPGWTPSLCVRKNGRALPVKTRLAGLYAGPGTESLLTLCWRGESRANQSLKWDFRGPRGITARFQDVYR
jgi:hypothetical protein